SPQAPTRCSGVPNRGAFAAASRKPRLPPPATSRPAPRQSPASAATPSRLASEPRLRAGQPPKGPIGSSLPPSQSLHPGGDCESHPVAPHQFTGESSVRTVGISPAELLAEVGRLGLRTPGDSASIIRAERDRQ